MQRNKLIGIGLIIVATFALIGVFFFFKDNSAKNTPAITEQEQNNTNNPLFEEESETGDPEYFDSFGLGKLNIESFGGATDIKTSIKNNIEYALFRNPQNIGGLEFALKDNFGTYYFAQNSLGEETAFQNGSPEGRFGYDEIGLVSGKLIREKSSSTEYYAAYPTKDIALKIGVKAFEDSGSANQFLKNKYLKITNLNSNISVITEIETRSELDETLLVSDAARIALKIDNKSTGSFSLEIVDKESNSLGVVR